MAVSKVPDWDDLPDVKGMPKGCAWGLWDQGEKKDIFGTLNLLSPDVVKEALVEAKDGVHVSLNWPLGAIKKPGFGRKPLKHTVINFLDTPVDCHGFDDEIEFNPQSSSQWDSLCHFHNQETQLAYNGVKPTVLDMIQEFGSEDIERKFPTLNHWHDRGGMVARGVFLDWKAYADAQGIKYNLFNDSKILIDDLEKIANHQGVSFKYGDVLIVRSGYTEALSKMNGDQQAQAMGSHRCIGVEGNIKAAKWVWNHHFSAVAGDMMAFEHIPPIKADGSEGKVGADMYLHNWFISLFGMSIGELWDLEALSQHCAKVKRYSFLLTSVPLNVSGCIGSPPNAIAIF